jgi:endonuclease/exonuclease/phosphatase family metal-dependent hydrolase
MEYTNFLQIKDKCEGQSVLSTLKVVYVNQQGLPWGTTGGDGNRRIALHVRVELRPGVNIDFTSVHLTYDADNQPNQLKALRTYLDSTYLNNSIGQIIMGDFNIGPDSLLDEFRGTGDKKFYEAKSGGPTFPSWCPSWFFDRLFYRGPLLRLIKSEVQAGNPNQDMCDSDHLYLTGEFELIGLCDK